MQEKAKENRQRRRSVRRAVRGAVPTREGLLRLALFPAWVGAAFLLGQAPMAFGTYPLGLALLCAGGSHTLAVLCGLIISALWQPSQPVFYILIYAVAALVRFLTSVRTANTGNTRAEADARLRIRLVKSAPPAKEAPQHSRTRFGAWLAGLFHISKKELTDWLDEGLKLRLLTGVIGSFLFSLYRVIAGGFQYYDLFAALFVLLLTPAAILAYAPACSAKENRGTLYKLSFALLLFSLVWGSSRVLFLGLPVSLMLALFFTLYFTLHAPVVEGIAAATLCGLAYHPLFAPGFVAAALVLLFFKTLRHEYFGIPAAVAVCLAWSFYVGGIAELPSEVAAALLSGCVLTVLYRLQRHEKNEDVRQKSPSYTALLHRVESDRNRDSSDRFRGISDAFSSLSEVFYNLSDRFRRPGTLDLRRMCDCSFDVFCTDCPNKTVCWGLEYASTLQTVGSLTSALHTKGKVTRAQIPDALAHRCEAVDEILAHINGECAKLTAEMLRNNRTEIFAMDYGSAADIINDALEEEDGEYRFDEEQAQKIADYLTDAGVRLQGVTVYGHRRRRIMVRGVDMEHAKVTVDTMRADLGEMCCMEASLPIFEIDGGSPTMTIQTKRKISVIGAQNNLSADGGVSGDTVNLFSNKKDYFYALINDGMGAGKEAALTSGLCSVFLEKMLRAGNRASTSLKMLNNMIRSRCADSAGECSSTVDLLELDLMNATAVFIKSGAAPSFVVRGKVVHRIQSGTAPIGIIGTLDAQSTTFYLKAGDTVVMISDGILQNDPEGEWISEYLTGAAALTPQEIVYRICLHASKSTVHDDCSAIALRIEKETA